MKERNKKRKSICLNGNEEGLYDKIKKNIEILRDYRREKMFSHERYMNILGENAKMCVKLHESLKSRGHPPIHYQCMMKNRGTLSNDSFEFYYHLHPQEDLIEFINNPMVVSEQTKPDVTMGEVFDFKVYSQRWGHYDWYKITRNADGWYVKFIAINGQCDRRGNPFLYKNFDQDMIAYVETDVESLMSSIWIRAEGGETKDKIQDYLNKVAEWVSLCEKSRPKGIDV